MANIIRFVLRSAKWNSMISLLKFSVIVLVNNTPEIILKVKRTIHKNTKVTTHENLWRIWEVKLCRLVSCAKQKNASKKAEPKSLSVHVYTYNTTCWALTHLTTWIPEAQVTSIQWLIWRSGNFASILV